ncbi:unnamed protein product, partial [Effrenium voratum]
MHILQFASWHECKPFKKQRHCRRTFVRKGLESVRYKNEAALSSAHEELELEETDLAQLRSQADAALKEKRQWELQLEVSRSCIQKLQARLLRVRRTKVDSKCGSEVERRLLAELEELVKQRDRFRQERAALEQQAAEHDREVQSLVLVLKAPPEAEGVLKQELASAEEEMEAFRGRAPESAHLDLKRKLEVVSEQITQRQLSSDEMSEQQQTYETQAQQIQATLAELAAEADAAKKEEHAARKEAAAKKSQCAECSVAIRRQQVLRAELVRRVRGLEAEVARARGEVTAEQVAQKSANVELEARCAQLRAEVEGHAAWRSKGTEMRSESEAETMQLEERTALVAFQLRADEAAQASIQAALFRSVRFAEKQEAELQAQELVSESLAEEIMRGARSEEALRAELVDERNKAREASSAAASFLERRRLKAGEAREALLQCDAALKASEQAKEELHQREQQLQHSARTSQIMHETLLQRLSAVHDKVSAAESAHAQALQELHIERNEQSRLNQELMVETTRERSHTDNSFIREGAHASSQANMLHRFGN